MKCPREPGNKLYNISGRRGTGKLESVFQCPFFLVPMAVLLKQNH